MSVRAKVWRFLSAQLFKKITPDADVTKVRNGFERVYGNSRAVRGVASEKVDIAGISCEWLIPKGCEDAPLLYYLHGGAYLMGSPGTHRKMVSYLAREAGVRALLPDYALAPENPFPAGLKDCVDVYRALLTSGETSGGIFIAGDSAGGGMSMAALLSLRDSGDPLPRAAILLSPWLDLTAQGESMTTRADHDPWFDPAHMPHIADYYCSEDERRNPLVSPVYADVSGLPHILIQVGDHEILLSDSTRLTGSITATEGQITLQVWPEMWHVFQFFIGKIPEAKRAIKDIAQFISSQRDVSPANGERIDNG